MDIEWIFGNVAGVSATFFFVFGFIFVLLCVDMGRRVVIKWEPSVMGNGLVYFRGLVIGSEHSE
ncbi:hypothetical protein [Bacillus alkalicola]|uniref:Uncharacterized protein n=1 Tax=Evansella alkalicola TaxID=745819 RepID=A0ABS6JUL5_9BACI|nr:hypothetical protein [Bacillus alkalicola]MBU9722273.1 hypothetical protein [Bacillus alkalicola]